MSVHYSEEFKKDVVKAYMDGDRPIVQIAADYNVAKSTVSEWVKNTEKNANIRKIPQKLMNQNLLKRFVA